MKLWQQKKLRSRTRRCRTSLRDFFTKYPDGINLRNDLVMILVYHNSYQPTQPNLIVGGDPAFSYSYPLPVPNVFGRSRARADKF